MNAWVLQDGKLKKKHGDKVRWSVGGYEPDGARRCKAIGSKSQAEKFRRKMEGELAAGTYQNESRKSWADFRREYESKMFERLEPGSREQTQIAINHFERICKPKLVSVIKTATIDDYVAKRSKERGLKRGRQGIPGDGQQRTQAYQGPAGGGVRVGLLVQGAEGAEAERAREAFPLRYPRAF